MNLMKAALSSGKVARSLGGTAAEHRKLMKGDPELERLWGQVEEACAAVCRYLSTRLELRPRYAYIAEKKSKR